MRGRHQGGQDGSLAGFIIVGVLLALVLVGGIYGLNRYNAQKASEEAAASQDDKKAKDTSTSKSSDQTAKTDDSDKSTSSGSSSQTQPDIPKDSETSTDSNASNQTAQSNVLPHTGPSDMTLGLLATMLLSFAAAHFVQSRRARL